MSYFPSQYGAEFPIEETLPMAIVEDDSHIGWDVRQYIK